MNNRERLDKVLDKHLNSLIGWLEFVNAADPMRSPIHEFAPIIEAVAAVGMYRSSRQLERLTQVLVVLTIVLAFLTAVLLWRTLA